MPDSPATAAAIARDRRGSGDERSSWLLLPLPLAGEGRGGGALDALRRTPTSRAGEVKTLLVEFDLGLAEPDEIRRRDRDRSVDAEHRDLEFVARFDRICEYDAIGHVEALDRGWARIAAAARHLAVDPDLRVIVHIGGEHRLGARRLEVADLCRNGQVGAIPDERHLAGTAAGRKGL